MLRIVLTGPESTGKTTLARRLAEYYGTAWVPEYARAYLEDLGRPYVQEDLTAIARGQVAWEEEHLPAARDLLFCDTGMLVLKVWSEFRYGSCDPWIMQQLRERPYHLYLLCGVDLPWAPDPLREHPHLREELWMIYQKELNELGLPFAEVTGTDDERFEQARAAVERLRSPGFSL